MYFLYLTLFLIKKDEKFFKFHLSELDLYKTFYDFQKDIGHTSDEIVQNWQNLQYIPWHVDRKPVPTDAQVESDKEEEHPNLQRDSRQHEWEIICG